MCCLSPRVRRPDDDCDGGSERRVGSEPDPVRVMATTYFCQSAEEVNAAEAYQW
jgi:hypothetical protein